MKTFKLDSWLHKIINRYLLDIVVILLLMISVLIRIAGAPHCDFGDYKAFLFPWYSEYKNLGIRQGLSQNIGDYYVPYNVVLALLSKMPCPLYQGLVAVHSVAEYVSAFFVYKIVMIAGKEKSLPEGGSYANHKAVIIAVLTLFNPMAILNNAVWKQADCLYTCFLIISLYLLLVEKYTRAFIVYSIAFCFKLQAVFFLPFLLIVYMKKQKFSIFQFFWIPLMYLLAGLPAILLGRGIKDTYGTYFRQIGTYKSISLNAANIYQLGLSDYQILKYIGIFMTVAVFIVTAWYICQSHIPMNTVNMIFLGAWSVWTCYLFLPCMHERYDYAAVYILSFLLMLTEGHLLSNLLINLVPLLTYAKYLFGKNDIPMYLISMMNLLLYAWFTGAFFNYNDLFLKKERRFYPDHYTKKVENDDKACM